MQYKILEQNGIDNENVDGAAFNNFCAGNRDGIIKEVLDECTIFKISNNTVAVSKGELLIHGVRVKIEELTPFTISSTPVVPTRYQLIADLVLTPEKTIEFSIICRVLQAGLVQEALYRNNSGHYQVEIARFTHSPTNGIENIVRTIDIITGGTSGQGSGELNIGNVTTQMLEAELKAEVDVENRYDEELGKYVTDFQFAIPKGATGAVGSMGGIQLISTKSQGAGHIGVTTFLDGSTVNDSQIGKLCLCFANIGTYSNGDVVKITQESSIYNGVREYDGTVLGNLRGDTGAAIVSTVLIGQDANGGNIYQQTFDNRVTAEFTAPPGPKGDTGPQGKTGPKGNDGAPGRNNISITINPLIGATFLIHSVGEEYWAENDDETYVEAVAGSPVELQSLGNINFNLVNMGDTVLLAYTQELGYVYVNSSDMVPVTNGQIVIFPYKNNGYYQIIDP